MYALVTTTGRLLDVSDEPHDLVNEGARLGQTAVIADDFEQNPRAHPTPEEAANRCGLPVIDFEQAMNLDPNEAMARLQQYFMIGQARYRWQPSQDYAQWHTFADALIGQNYKLGKNKKKAAEIAPKLPPSIRARVLKANVYGLNLVPAFMPHTLLRDFQRGIPRLHEKPVDPRYYTDGKVADKGTDFCVGSSPECRSACLVYAGQNGASTYNAAIKLARTRALLAEPEAFVCLLGHAIERFVESTQKMDMDAYFRLNVLSDIPWEVITPGLFEYFSSWPISFYDYTKVADRKPPKNYDLTFSFSGRNLPLVHDEIAVGRRIAVVFLLEGVGQKSVMKHQLPESLLGLPVIDGDLSDVRPLDPSPSIVGLRWKIPLGQKLDPRNNSVKAFVIPCHKIDGRFVAGVVPGTQPGDSTEEELP